MDTDLTTGQILDSILKYCLDNEKTGWIGVEYLKQNLYPELHTDEIMLLLNRINNSSDPVATVILKDEYTTFIKSNGITKRFLEQGGFTEIENNEEADSIRQFEKDQLEFEKSKVDLELAKETLKDLPKTRKRAKLAIIISGIAIFVQLLEWIIKLLSN